jgi:hypothetical protein
MREARARISLHERAEPVHEQGGLRVAGVGPQRARRDEAALGEDPLKRCENVSVIQLRAPARLPERSARLPARAGGVRKIRELEG